MREQFPAKTVALSTCKTTQKPLRTLSACSTSMLPIQLVFSTSAFKTYSGSRSFAQGAQRQE